MNPIERGQRFYARYLENCARARVQPVMTPEAFCIGAQSRYERYVNRGRGSGRPGGTSFRTGQTDFPAVPKPSDGKNCCWYDDSIGGGKPYCKPRPHRCDCHVLGGTTLSTTVGDGPGVAATAFGQLVIDSGDADQFYPYFISIVAFERVNDSQIDITDQRIVLLTDSKSGQTANMRRASQVDPSFGAHALIFGELKELECVDWNPFSSRTRQELNLWFYNPTAAAVHVFVNIWGTPTPYGCGEQCEPGVTLS